MAKTNKQKLKDRKEIKLKLTSITVSMLIDTLNEFSVITAVYCKGCGTQIKGLKNVMGALVMIPLLEL